MTPPNTPEIERKVTAQLGRRLLKILAPMRVRSLSLHDATGEPLWFSNGDEFSELHRRQVQEAQDAFALDRSLQHLERDLENSRALFFCTRTPDGERTGLAFAVVSGRRRPDVDPVALRERVFATMRRFSAGEPLPSGVVDARPPEQQPTDAQIAAMESAKERAGELDQDPQSLRSRPYARLRPGGTTRRYEIADASVASTQNDLTRAARLITLLKRRGARDTPVPASFALPLCAASVLSGEFLARIEPMLHEAHLSHDILGFILPTAAWELDAAATLQFLERCAGLRCFAALDDYSLTRAGFALLRSPALRCVKLDPAVTAGVLDDKFAHANVAAIVKAARVLGLYCVAKAVKSPGTARWLASAGVEFAERASRAQKAGSTTRSGRALTLAS
jgi:EAL domain-containing protein (putative c-di-GMP-specific phosphodiesterase class I)